MKNKTRILVSFFALLLTAFTAGCGERDARLPVELPNRMVDRTETAGQAVLAAGKLNLEEVLDQRAVAVEVDYSLAQQALILGLMPSASYLKLQQKWVGSSYPACNFFLITALCESHYCETAKPFYKAADFDLYFLQTGWDVVSLPELKDLFRSKQKFDAVFQKNGVTASRPGHVMVAVGLDKESGQIKVAEGSLGTITHQVETVTDSHLLTWNGGFKIFVNRAPAYK